MMFDYLWGEIAIIVFGMWIALLFVAIGMVIEHERMDSRRRKDILRGLDNSRPFIPGGDGIPGSDRGVSKERRGDDEK